MRNISFLYFTAFLVITGCVGEENILGDDTDTGNTEDLQITVVQKETSTYIATPYPEELRDNKITYEMEINVRKQNGEAVDSAANVTLAIRPVSVGITFLNGKYQYSDKTNHIGKLIVLYSVKPIESQNHTGKSVTLTASLRNNQKASLVHHLKKKQN